MKKVVILFCSVFMLMAAVTANAQSMGSTYRTALGAKAYFVNGSTAGINIKHFLNGNNALEGSVLFKENFFALEGVYEWHGNISGARGLKWYVGPGAWLGFYNNKYNNNDKVLFALKGTLGLDYKFTGAPINIAFDINPTFNLTPVSDFDLMAGLAFRFTF